MNPLAPGYGETPLDDEELVALQPDVRAALGERVSKVDIYDLEQAVQEHVASEYLTNVLDQKLSVDDLLTDHGLRALHARLYGEIWTWAGVYRRRELNLGAAPAVIATGVRSSLDSIRLRWRQTRDWTARELGVACHADIVRIHPFTDGNGRTTRLLADLVFIAAQEADTPSRYSWDLDKPRYISLLREYDQHRDPRALAAFIEIRGLDE